MLVVYFLNCCGVQLEFILGCHDSPNLFDFTFDLNLKLKFAIVIKSVKINRSLLCPVIYILKFFSKKMGVFYKNSLTSSWWLFADGVRQVSKIFTKLKIAEFNIKIPTPLDSAINDKI